MRFQHSNFPSTLQGAWKFKVDYYKSDEMDGKLHEAYGNKEIFYGAIIISLRGLWCSSNDETLEKLNISKGIKELLVVRCMERTVKTWKHFMKST